MPLESEVIWQHSKPRFGGGVACSFTFANEGISRWRDGVMLYRDDVVLLCEGRLAGTSKVWTSLQERTTSGQISLCQYIVDLRQISGAGSPSSIR